MEGSRSKPNAASTTLWLACALSILVWHAVMVAGMWGGQDCWATLLDDRPVTSGSHPLHQYHGWLGARSLIDRANLCCYDPRFQAGSIRSPAFSAGGQLASLFYLLVWGSDSPQAYKMGLAAATMLVPVLLFIAAVGFGLRPLAALLATGLGVAVWWSDPGQRSFAAGHIDRLFSGVLLVAWLGLLGRFDRFANFKTWAAMLFIGAAALFVQPLVMIMALPLLLLYYFDAGTRHRTGLWHFALVGGIALILAVNLFWLLDWAYAWWLRTPPEATATQPRTLRNLWDNVAFWGSLGDRLLIAGLMCGGAIALVTLNRETWRRLRLAILAVPYLLAIVVLGHGQRLGELAGTHGLLFPALWLAAIVAADRLTAVLSNAVENNPLTRAVVLGGVAICMTAVAWLVVADLRGRPSALASPPPLTLGLTTRQSEVAELLAQQCDQRGRVLWEDLPEDFDSAWALQVMLHSGCGSIGALDERGETIFATVGLRGGRLATLPIETWSDKSLLDYCRRFNIGWIAARSKKTRDRLRKWPLAVPCGRVEVDPPVELFRIERGTFDYTVRGKATLVEASCSRLVFADVEPEDGEVVLAFHHVGSISAYPRRVRVERDAAAKWPLPLIRLRVSSRVSRVTLEWRPR